MRDTDGYGLWLDCEPLTADRASAWRPVCDSLYFPGSSPVLETARTELSRIFAGLFESEAARFKVATRLSAGFVPTLAVGLRGEIVSAFPGLLPAWAAINDDGYRLFAPPVAAGTPGAAGTPALVAVADSEKGLLYAVFALKRLLEDPSKQLAGLDILDEPAIRYRMMDHWDNLDGSIERGYAGKTLWKWAELPSSVDSRYNDYARACASVGLNCSVLNNVNTQPQILSTEYLEKVAAIAAVLRPWGVTTYLSVNFGSPRFLGGLETSDPLDPAVIAW